MGPVFCEVDFASKEATNLFHGLEFTEASEYLFHMLIEPVEADLFQWPQSAYFVIINIVSSFICFQLFHYQINSMFAS